MKYWTCYNGHQIIKIGKKEPYDNTIYSFDIETSSYIILDNIQHNTIDYLDFNDKEKDRCIFNSLMYIWMFSINNDVYYGRTWRELRLFLDRLEYYTLGLKKYVFVHNLSFEFQFLRNEFTFDNVFSRKSRKVIKCNLEDYNIEFRCTLYMTNVKLEKLAKVYNLNTKKLVGSLDYSKIRHNETKLSQEELNYCENDCLIIYEYIKLQLQKYKYVKKLPLTSTGFVRKELKELLQFDYRYKAKVKKSINTDGHIFNVLEKAFMGGYTHANWTKANEIYKDVVSYDFASSYPFVMLTEKYPCSIFRKCNIKRYEDIIDKFCYLIDVTFYNIQCKYFNNFISQSKCVSITNGKYDNGRLISADKIQIILTDVDFKFIYKTHDFSKYKFNEVYWSYKDYLPIEYIKFILSKYKIKTEYKDVKGKEIDYALEKAKFNRIIWNDGYQ